MLLFALCLCPTPGPSAEPQSHAAPFVQWESPHVHPLELDSAGGRLLAVNTIDHRLEVFRIGEDGRPVLEREVFVGLEPVSVRLESADSAWVVNHVSDSVSVVDLERGVVVATLDTDDEPADVVFAGSPRRAFVSCSQANTVLVFDPADPGAAPRRIALDGEDPRALAVSADGASVYAALFESGNRTTVLAGGSLFNLDFPPNVVGKGVGPYSGRNPPPNSAAEGGFEPALRAGLPAPPAVGLIVRQGEDGHWRDDFVGDWTQFVGGPNARWSGRVPGWELTDHDLARIDVESGEVSYVRHLMNVCMAIAVDPIRGSVAVLGTDARNEVRYEPNLRGRFVDVLFARVGKDGERLDVHDLNPHLDPAAHSVEPKLRSRSIGDPRGALYDAKGERLFVSGMGSDHVLVLDAEGRRLEDLAPIPVGEGPTGLALDEEHSLLYVLCKFESAISVVDLAEKREIARVPFFDPTPQAVRRGRRSLFSTHAHSGKGQVSCASCHVDARTDHLGWDLGDPSGEMVALEDRNLAADDPVLRESRVPGRGGFEPFHPMKGPMTTQPLLDIVGKEPFHWRGDRSGLRGFRGAFVTLLGGDAPPDDAELADLRAYLATLAVPPNPYCTLENGLPRDLPLDDMLRTGRFGEAGTPLPHGDALRGLERFRTGKLDNTKVDCVACHTLPSGVGPDARLADGEYRTIPPNSFGEHHHMLTAMDGSTNVTMKVPQLRGLGEKVGFELSRTRSHFGFGFVHDGSVDTLARFVTETSFTPESDQDTADLVALLLAFSGSDFPRSEVEGASAAPSTPSLDTHAAVGRQVTLAGPASGEQLARLARFLALAESGAVGLVVRATQDGVAHGLVHRAGGVFESGRAEGALRFEELIESAAPGAERTFTVVRLEDAERLGIDRDADGVADQEP